MAQNNIKELREDRGFSQQELADKVGTTQSQIYRLENSERRLTTDWIKRLAKALECHPNELSSEFALRPDQQALLHLYEGLAERERTAFLGVGAAMAQRGEPEGVETTPVAKQGKK